MQFVIQTVSQPHVISDWIKSSIPLCTCKIVCQEGKCREMSHEGLIPSLWRCTVTRQRGPMSIPNCGAWKSCVCVIHAILATGRAPVRVTWAQSSPVPRQLVGCACPLPCHPSLSAAAVARGTKECNWLETPKEITSTHAGRNSECFWVHTCIWSESKICAEQTCLRGGVPCTRQSESVPNTNVNSECRDRTVVLMANSLFKQ